MLKLSNVQNVYINNKKVTTFKVWLLLDNEWIFYYNSSIEGWYKRNETIATKHCAGNGVVINLKDWAF